MPTAKSVGKVIAHGVVSRVSPQATSGVLRRVMQIAIDGVGRLPSAKAVAGRQLERRGGSVEEAIEGVIDSHIRLGSAQGFVTNLGGIATLPVTMPANVAGVAIVQVRMVAAIAHLRGYDINDDRVRTALVMCLLGGEQIAKGIKNGKLPTSPLAVATAPVFDPELDSRVAEATMSGLFSRIGGKNLALVVTRRVPLLGGGIGATMDGIATNQIAKYAKSEFVRRRALQN